MFSIEEKKFDSDLRKVINKLKKREPFAFSKYADGELHIFVNKEINNGEFWFDPKTNAEDRKRLINSFQYKDDNYFVGVCCSCCGSWGISHKWMVKQSGQNEENLTWANLFVNSNYQIYLNEMIPIYSEYEVVLVSNSASNLENLPFNIKKHFKIGKNAWVNDLNLLDEIKEYIDNNCSNHTLFLFCAGPYGNILTHQLFDHNKNNTYIDIGSTLNPFLLGEYGKNTRDYLKGGRDLYKTCIWGAEERNIDE